MTRPVRPRAAALAALAALLAGALLLAGCSAGDGAAARGGTFEFSSPSGSTEIFYNPPSQRGTVGRMSGPAVRDASRTVALRRFAGQVVVLNVWGSWCGPCRAEADDLQRIHELAGVSVLGVNIRDDRQDAADFMRAYGQTYPSMYDPPGRALFAVQGIPRSAVPLTVVLDRRHRVAAVFLREISSAELRPVVRALT